MLTRRGFFGMIAAGLALMGVKPRTSYRPYRAGDRTLAIDDTRWGGEHRISLWDGGQFVKVVTVPFAGRAVVVPFMDAPRGKLAETRFAHVGRDTSGLADIASQYEYGPKWWKHGRAKQERHLRRAGVVNHG